MNNKWFLLGSFAILVFLFSFFSTAHAESLPWAQDIEVSEITTSTAVISLSINYGSYLDTVPTIIYGNDLESDITRSDFKIENVTTDGYDASIKLENLYGNPSYENWWYHFKIILDQGTDHEQVYQYQSPGYYWGFFIETPPAAVSIEASSPHAVQIYPDVAEIQYFINSDNVGDFNSYIEYGTSTNYSDEKYASCQLDYQGYMVCKVELKYVKPKTTYHYRVVVFDRNGNTTNTNDFEFTTLSIISGSNVSTQIWDSPVVVVYIRKLVQTSLQRNYPIYLEYGKDQNYGSTKTISTLTGSPDANPYSYQDQIFHLEGNTTYHYRIVGGNGTDLYEVSEDRTFTTQSAPSNQLSIIGPNGGEKLPRGESYTIKWTGGGDKVDAFLVSQSTGIVYELNPPYIELSNEYVWDPAKNLYDYNNVLPELLSQPPLGKYKIRLVSQGNTSAWDNVDESDDWFEILDYLILTNVPNTTIPNPTVDLTPYGVTQNNLEGELVKTSDRTTVYLVKGGKRYSFPNQRIYEAWYGSDFSQVQTVSAEELASYQLAGNVLYKPGSLIKIPSIPKVYLVIDDGKLRWIETEAKFSQLGLSFGQVQDLPESFFFNYSEAESIK